MSSFFSALVKLVLVLATIALVAAGVYIGYNLVFPSSGSGTLTLPKINLTSCGAKGSGSDPADIAYSYQLGQHQDEVNRPAGTDNKEVTFTVTEGEPPSAIAVKLKNQGFVRDSDLFVTLLKCRHASEKIQAGDHVLRHNMTMDEVALALQRGTLRGVTVTVTPGLRAEQIAEYLKGLNLAQFDANEFVKLVKQGGFDHAFLQDRPKNAEQSVEGFLFPETYNVLQGITAEQLINRFLSEYDQRVTPDMRQKAADQKMTLYEAMTLASIVEREAVLKEEAPIIASVYLNRLKANTSLDADPTVQYALGYQAATKQWWPVIPLDQYRKVNSPYNTYINTGLPPGPICEPGLTAIRAALEPAKTDYLYFLAKGDGAHVFAKTLQEQNANLAKYGYQPPKPKP